MITLLEFDIASSLVLFLRWAIWPMRLLFLYTLYLIYFFIFSLTSCDSGKDNAVDDLLFINFDGSKWIGVWFSASLYKASIPHLHK